MPFETLVRNLRLGNHLRLDLSTRRRDPGPASLNPVEWLRERDLLDEGGRLSPERVVEAAQVDLGPVWRGMPEEMPLHHQLVALAAYLAQGEIPPDPARNPIADGVLAGTDLSVLIERLGGWTGHRRRWAIDRAEGRGRAATAACEWFLALRRPSGKVTRDEEHLWVRALDRPVFYAGIFVGRRVCLAEGGLVALHREMEIEAGHALPEIDGTRLVARLTQGLAGFLSA